MDTADPHAAIMYLRPTVTVGVKGGPGPGPPVHKGGMRKKMQSAHDDGLIATVFEIVDKKNGATS